MIAFEQKRMNEADMALYASWGIRNPLTAAMTHSGEWTVDAENNIYLVSFGGRGDFPENSDLPPSYFLLRYKGLNVFFIGRSTIDIIVEGERWRTNWFFEVTAPNSLKDEIETILRLVADAILCQKSARRPGLAGKIEVQVVINSIALKN